MLSVKNLDFSYSSEHDSENKEILKNISFMVEKGEYVVLVGANGSGKSTLVRLLCGFLSADDGTIIIADSDSSENRTVPSGIVFQSPRDQLVANIVRHDTAFGPENLALPANEVDRRIQSSLEVTGLLKNMIQKTITLSLGQKQKLAFAGIIALHPSILLLDETLSMVDCESRAEILAFIDEYHKAGNTIIHVTHREEEIQRAERVLFLQNGQLAFDGTVSNYTKNLKTEEKSLYNNYESKKEQSEFSLRLEHVCFSLQTEEIKNSAHELLFDDLSLSFKKGTLTALTGKSGSGKTTLMELVCGLLKPQKGSIYCAQRPVLAMQESESALFEEFAADDVAYALSSRGVNGSELTKKIKSAMDQVSLPFEKFADRRTFSLSGGEKRKLSIAGILALDVPIYFFDEPTAGLDVASVSHIMNLMRSLANEGKTVIFSTHSKKEELYADRVIRLENGHVVSDSAQSDSSAHSRDLPQIEPYDEAKRLVGLQRTALGMYSAKKSIVHNLSPVLKYLCMLALLITGLAASSFSFLSGVIAVALMYALFARYPLYNLIGNIVRIMPWLLFFFLLQVFFFEAPKSDIVYITFAHISITDGKIFFALKTMLHYIAALIALSVFLYSTDESEIIEGLRDILHPLTFLKIPTQHVVLVISMIFRFIPLLAEEAALIIKAQTIRNGGKKKRGLFKNVRSMIPIFVPLLLQTLRRAEAFADALQARYY